MARDSDPSQPPPARRPDNSTPSNTTIDSLSDDIILEIFLRLPSFTALVRAAFTRRAWRRAVASSPTFRGRFRDLHPAPLLGLFFAPFSPVQAPNVPGFPAFAPTRRQDRDLAAAVRTGDFFLTSIQARAGDPPPPPPPHPPIAAAASHGFIDVPKDILNDHRGFPIDHDTKLICSDEDPMSYRLVALAHDRSRVRAAVFSSATREWSLFPWVRVSRKPHRPKFWLEKGMQADGSFMYWAFTNRKRMITLDTTTMELSVAELPQSLKNRRRSFVVGETMDGGPCIVYADQFNVGVLMHGTDDDGIKRWMETVVSLDAEVDRVVDLPDDHDGLNVVAIRNGFVYLATSKMYHDPLTPCWFLSLCLDTMELEKLFQRTFDGDMYPYIMPWPPCLVGDHGKFTGEVAP
ncbi:hypothetical protein ACP70R_037234 [Stipagrostis hirtigluma subsp. patula]